jgi:hypothetical protein
LDTPEVAQQNGAHGHDDQRYQSGGLGAVAAGCAPTGLATFAQLLGRLYR